MTKDEYILRSLSKIKHKKWELYIISRILHKLDDLEIEFVCQQLIKRKDGKNALADIFFPQFKLYLEIDEPPHHNVINRKEDWKRTQSIFDATQFDEKRITVYISKTKNKTLDVICSEVENFVESLKRKKKNMGCSFFPWDYENQYNPKQHIKRGYIDLKVGAQFRYQKDAKECFGYRGGHAQSGGWRIPSKDNEMVWFPKLYENKDWKNELTDDGQSIIELRKVQHTAYLGEVGEKPHTRVVFAHETDVLGSRLYRFKGVFKLEEKKSNKNGVIYRKICDKYCLPNIKSP